jgi:hypothetical protein
MTAVMESGIDLSKATDAELIAEISDRRWESDAIDDFYDEIGKDAVDELTEEQAVVDFGTLEELNGLFWTAPEQAPVLIRQWLQRITGRV